MQQPSHWFSISSSSLGFLTKSGKRMLPVMRTCLPSSIFTRPGIVLSFLSGAKDSCALTSISHGTS
jgi:hypothetical protein